MSGYGVAETQIAIDWIPPAWFVAPVFTTLTIHCLESSDGMLA
jgi:hypothetical protein